MAFSSIARVSLGSLAACCLLVFAAPGARAQLGPACDAVPGHGYDVSVQIDVPKPRLDRTMPRSALTGFAPHGAGRAVLGAMRAPLEVSSVATYGHIASPHGACVWVESVKIVLKYRSVDLFVAKEYSPSSCAYRAILAHEEQHAEIARTYVNRYAPRIRQALASLLIPKAAKPASAPSREAAEARVEQVLERLVAPVVAALESEMSKAQAEIDTQRSYQNVFRQCNDW